MTNSALTTPFKRSFWIAILTTGLISFSTAPAFAQEDLSIDKIAPDIGELEVNHDLAQVEAMMVPVPDNPVVDTVLSFSRPESRRALVKCIGYNRKGEVSGRARTIVPGNGVAFMFASDLANNTSGRFIGSVRCYSTSEVIPTAYLTGPQFEPLEAITSPGWNRSQLFFPLAATL